VLHLLVESGKVIDIKFEIYGVGGIRAADMEHPENKGFVKLNA
jgi:hypothetical protein